jgi:AraC-like DNA-binding protein
VYRTPGLDRDSVHRVLPDPAMNIEFSCHRDESGRPHDPRIRLIGPKTRPQLAAFDPGLELVAVKVKLEWTTAVVGLGPTEHWDTDIDLGEVEPELAALLEASLFETPTLEAASAVLMARVGQHLAARRVPGRPSVAAGALDLVRRTHGQCPVAQIADRMSTSVRTLRRVVAREAGVSLKTYARTVRLLRAVTTADAHPTRRWATVAADAGFYDQAHLIRECQALCGQTPGDVLQERRAELDDAGATWDRADTGIPIRRSTR